MKLEEAIFQKKFVSEYQKLMVNIMYTNINFKQVHNNHLRPFGISIQQYNLLRILRGQYPNPVSINLLIDRMLDKMSNASRLVEKLKQKGLVERAVATSDRRRVDVLITKRGLDLLNEMDGKLEDFENRLKSFSQEDAGKLNDLLDDLNSILLSQKE